MGLASSVRKAVASVCAVRKEGGSLATRKHVGGGARHGTCFIRQMHRVLLNFQAHTRRTGASVISADETFKGYGHGIIADLKANHKADIYCYGVVFI